MSNSETTKAIDVRYTKLADETCCLSCGTAMDRAQPQPGEVCVDLGSGRGTDVLRMAEEVGDEGFVYGVDVSEGMLEKARKTAAKLEISNVQFLKGELDALPLEDESVDVVISNCTINHAHDKFAVWEEVYRILKPGGRFVVSDIYAVNEIPDRYRTDPQAVAECWAGAVTKEVYISQVSEAGIDDLQILDESKPYEKGEVEVVSWTIFGTKPKCCGCGCSCS